MLDGIAHIHGDFLPGHEAQIPLLQKELVLGVGDGFHPAGDLPLQIHQFIDVVVDLVLQIHDLDHRFRHAGLGAVGVAGHPRKGGRGVGGQIVESRDLLDFGVDPGIQKPGLG